jgi:hypothetical protein
MSNLVIRFGGVSLLAILSQNPDDDIDSSGRSRRKPIDDRRHLRGILARDADKLLITRR